MKLDITLIVLELCIACCTNEVISQDICPLVAIDGLTVQTSSSYVASSTPFNITISVVDGTPELFVISISEQGDPVDEIIVERSNLCETFRPTQIEIVLQERGEYKIAVSGSNDISSDYAEVEVTAQNPITGLEIFPTAIVRVLHYPVTFNFNFLVYPESPRPSNLVSVLTADLITNFRVFRQRSNWDINWPRSDTIPWSVTWNEDEAPPGLYTANITFYNQISECSSSTQVQIVQDLYNVTVRSSSGSNDGSPGSQIYNPDEEIHFQCYVEKGDIEWVTWRLPSQTTFNTTSCSFNHTFPYPCSNTVLVTVHNQLSSATGQITVVTLEPGTPTGLCSTKSISNFSASMDSAFHRSGDPFNLTMSLDEGAPVTYVIRIWKDGVLVNITTVERNDSCVTYVETVVVLVIMDPGQYSMSVCASNKESTSGVQIEVNVQNPLEEFYLYEPPVIYVTGDYVDVYLDYEMGPPSPIPTSLYRRTESDLDNYERTQDLSHYEAVWRNFQRNPRSQLLRFEEDKIPPGIYTVNQTMYNLVSSIFSSVKVKVVKDNHVQVTSSPASGLVSQEFEAYTLDEEVTFGCTLEWGAIEHVTWTISNEVTINSTSCNLNYNFTSPCNHTVVAAVHNWHSVTYGQTSIIVLPKATQGGICPSTEIRNIKVGTSSYSRTSGTPFDLKIFSEGGSPQMYVIRILRDGVFVNKTTLVGNTTCELYTETSTRLAIADPGQYMVSACSSNNVSFADDQLEITVQNPIRGFGIDRLSPLRLRQYPITIAIKYWMLPEAPRPTNLYLGYVTDMNNLEGLMNLETWDAKWPSISTQLSWIVSFTENELPPGLYSVTLRLFNKVSDFSSSTEVLIIQDLSNVTVTSSYAAGLTSSSSWSHMNSGAALVGYFSLEETVYFDCAVETGSVEWVTWEVETDKGNVLVLVNTSSCGWNYTFSSPGNHTIRATASNRYSSATGSVTVVISGRGQQSNTGVHSVTTDKYVIVNKPAIFSLHSSFISDSTTECMWDFSDGTVSAYSQEYLNSAVVHIFSEVGTYLVIVTCSTAGGSSVQDSIQVQVSPLLERLYCRVTDKGGQTKSSFPIDDGLLFHYHHKFADNVKHILLHNENDLNVSATASQNDDLLEGTLSISQEVIRSSIGPGRKSLTLLAFVYDLGVQCTLEVDLQETVGNISAHLNSSVVATNVTFDLTVGLNGGDPISLNLTVWTAGEKVLERTIVEHQRGRKDISLTTALELTLAGLHRIVIMGWNDVSFESLELNMTAQNPILGLEVDTIAPIIWEGSPVSVNISVHVHPLHPPPSDVFISVDSGDGLRTTAKADWVDQMTGEGQVEVLFTGHGIHTVDISLFNEISKVSTSVDIHILQEITDVQVEHYSGISLGPYDVHKYPLEYPVSFNCSVSEGTVQWVTWEVNNDTIANTTSCRWSYTFPFVGIFTIDATVTNMIFTEKGSTTVETLESVADVLLVNNGPLMLDQNITFVLFVGRLGTDSSFRMTFGDGQSTTISNLTKFDETVEYLKPGLLLPFDPAEQYSAILSHQYEVEGNYIAMAYGWNLVSSLSTLTEVTINLKPCEIPYLHISSGVSNLTVAPTFVRTHPVILHADVSVDCQGSGSTTYRWRLFKLDKVFPYPSIANEVQFAGDVETRLVECYIPKYTLEYGDYVVEITVTAIMRRDGSVGMMEFDQSYLKVVPKSLVPRIMGGSLRLISWYSALSLDGSISYDPDRSPTLGSDPGLTFSWYCRMSNETFPDDLEEKDYAKGGCFGKGYRISSDELMGVTAQSTLGIPAQLLEGNKTYTFKLLLGKAGRTSVTAEQTIRLLPGDVPSVLIRCIHNCDQYLNPSERFVVSGKCEDCTEFSRPRYQWDLIPDVGTEVTKEFDWKRDTTTGKFNAYLVIKAGVLADTGVDDYVLRLHTYSWAGTTNFAEFTFSINSPPTGGWCFIAPSEGVVLFTYFYISCSRFYDRDTPFSYELRLMTGDIVEDSSQTSGSLLHFGVDSIFPPTLLPVGSPSRDYIVNIALIVRDAFGASTVSYLNATVKEPPPKEASEMFNQVINMTQGEDSDMQHLLKSGDTQAATQLITTVSSILNSKTESDDSDDEDNEERETRIQVREQLITNLNQVEIRDLESLQLTSAAVAEVTQENTEISAVAQLSASAMYEKMGRFLQAQAHDQSMAGASAVTIEGTARQLVVGLANILGAAARESPMDTEERSYNSGEDATSVNTRQVTLSSMETLKSIEGAILHNKVPGEEATVLKTDQVEVLLNRLEKWELDGKSFEIPERSTFVKLPQDFRNAQDLMSGDDGVNSYDAILDAHVHHYERNPFPWSSVNTSISSHVTSLDIIKSENETLEVSGLTDGVNLFLENDIDAESVTLKAKDNFRRGDKLFGFNISEGASAVVIHLRAQSKNDLVTDTPNMKVMIYEDLNSTEALHSFLLPQESPLQIEWNETSVMTADPYSILLDGDTILEGGNEAYYINIELGGTLNWTEDWDLVVMTYSPQCYYWSVHSESWKTDGCQPGPLTDLQRLHCVCNHLSTFAGGVIPLPNAINLKEDILLFAELFENPVTTMTVLSVFSVFLLCAVWARRKDRREEKESEVIYLADNDPDAQYQYHITVMTGMRRGAGTSSTVTVTLYGTHGSCHPHVLTAPHRPVLERGGTDSFMIATDGSLGELTALRVWHDNSGSHPDWYVSRIVVHDLQSNGWWYFLCQSWLGIGIGEDSLDKTFPTASQEDLTHFHHLVLSKIQRDIKDQHLWVSVMVRPAHSTFTRLQRAACCLAIILTAMLSNIIFYGVPEQYATEETNISFGSLSLSWSSVVIGVESSIITFPINYLIVELFRNSRLHQRKTRSGSTSSFSFSLSSAFSQLTFASANSKISSLYESCRIFLSSGSQSLNSNSVRSTSRDVTSIPPSSTPTQSSIDSFNSKTALIGERCSSVTPTGSSLDSNTVYKPLSTPDSPTQWNFIHSADHGQMETNFEKEVGEFRSNLQSKDELDGIIRCEDGSIEWCGVREAILGTRPDGADSKFDANMNECDVSQTKGCETGRVSARHKVVSGRDAETVVLRQSALNLPQVAFRGGGRFIGRADGSAIKKGPSEDVQREGPFKDTGEEVCQFKSSTGVVQQGGPFKDTGEEVCQQKRSTGDVQQEGPLRDKGEEVCQQKRSTGDVQQEGPFRDTVEEVCQHKSSTGDVQQEGPFRDTGEEVCQHKSSTGVVQQEGPFIYTGEEVCQHKSSTGVVQQEGPFRDTVEEVCQHESSTGVFQQEGPYRDTGEEVCQHKSSTGVVQQEGPFRDTGEEVCQHKSSTGIVQQKGPFRDTGEEVCQHKSSTGVVQQEGPFGDTGEEVCQHKSSTGVVQQEGPFRDTGEEVCQHKSSTGIVQQKGPFRDTGEEVCQHKSSTGVVQQEGPCRDTGEEVCQHKSSTGVFQQKGPYRDTGEEVCQHKSSTRDVQQEGPFRDTGEEVCQHKSSTGDVQLEGPFRDTGEEVCQHKSSTGVVQQEGPFRDTVEEVCQHESSTGVFQQEGPYRDTGEEVCQHKSSTGVVQQEGPFRDTGEEVCQHKSSTGIVQQKGPFRDTGEEVCQHKSSTGVVQQEGPFGDTGEEVCQHKSSTGVVQQEGPFRDTGEEVCQHKSSTGIVQQKGPFRDTGEEVCQHKSSTGVVQQEGPCRDTGEEVCQHKSSTGVFQQKGPYRDTGEEVCQHKSSTRDVQQEGPFRDTGEEVCQHKSSTGDVQLEGPFRDTGEEVCQQKTLDIIGKKSDSSGYISGNQVQRAVYSDDSLTNLMPTNEEEERRLKEQPTFYPYHQDYLQSKLNHLKSEIEALPEMDESKRQCYRKAGKKLDRVLYLHGWSCGKEDADEVTNEDEEREEDGDIKKYEEFKGCLPWWSIYISWFLVVITCMASSFFIILYGLRYGKQQSIDWLVAMFISLFQSVAVVQPIKVVVLATMFAILLPSHTHDQIGLGKSRIVNAREVVSKGGNLVIPLQQLRNSSFYKPPVTKRVEKARKKRLARAKMYSLLKATLGQVAFIFLVLEIAYMQRDPNTYLMHHTLSNIFTEEADEVGKSEDLQEWMKEVFVPNLYGGVEGFITGDLALRLGGARLRQLRIETYECEVDTRMQSFSKECKERSDETGGPIGGPWDTSSDPESPWVYQPASILEGSFTTKTASARNDRGGYAIYLGTTYESAMNQLEFIEDTSWIDSGTKAVFIEWNLFNPHTNLLCICSMLYEQQRTGAYTSSSHFEVMRPLDMKTPVDKISLSLESVYILVILALILIEAKKYRRNRAEYWDFWNLLTLFIIFLSLLSTAVYIFWLTSLWNILQSYLRDPEEFHSYFKPAFLSHVFNNLVAFIVFFSTLKCAKILRYNRTIHLMQVTFKFLARKFSMSLLVVAIIFFAFTNLSFQLFGSSIYIFNSIVSSLESMFLFVSGGFDQFLEVSDQYPVLGPTFFIIISFVLIYIFMNLMIIFIVESFMRAQVYCDELDHRDVVGVFIDWFISVIGVKTETKDKEDLTEKDTHGQTFSQI
ncbi:uncharacterized protein [Apostichopus japonicus]|uniref:uncharacterized protein isoform X2 n=1 Tax=Stichopus japonicus TaxID=307972 RepID=UPI003AB54206